ncbi:hypothetical protein [Sporanaerobacter acetigenes]|uniref:Uncharacterized protein n=1 Tax=Sporanaerobacter acetigenes DSM 13106 TaxID=1123281 RepID=A0A1M5Z9R5_9FIRM|nr:hypothetical protein [Sporanaerobacter acetigenes]SHI20975.1 hypothetical protein SAMN02745180_02890 [Sporanaerobacter acetigenes DSM 13106]
MDCTFRTEQSKFNEYDYQDVFEYLSDEDVMKYIELSFQYQQVEEFVNKFIFQYIYYIFEIILVVLSIAFGQKAGDVRFNNRSLQRRLILWRNIF